MSSKIVGWLVGVRDGKILRLKKKSGIQKKIPEQIRKWWILYFCRNSFRTKNCSRSCSSSCSSSCSCSCSCSNICLVVLVCHQHITTWWMISSKHQWLICNFSHPGEYPTQHCTPINNIVINLLMSGRENPTYKQHICSGSSFWIFPLTFFTTSSQKYWLIHDIHPFPRDVIKSSFIWSCKSLSNALFGIL